MFKIQAFCGPVQPQLVFYLDEPEVVPFVSMSDAL